MLKWRSRVSNLQDIWTLRIRIQLHSSTNRDKVIARREMFPSPENWQKWQVSVYYQSSLKTEWFAYKSQKIKVIGTIMDHLNISHQHKREENSREYQNRVKKSPLWTSKIRWIEVSCGRFDEYAKSSIDQKNFLYDDQICHIKKCPNWQKKWRSKISFITSFIGCLKYLL
jgi:hypothetical protein